MNKDKEYLLELETDLNRVIGILSDYQNQVHSLIELNYTPQTHILLKGLKFQLNSTNIKKLNHTVNRGL